MMDCITSGIIWSKWTFCVFGWKRIKGWTVVERALNKITITWCYFDKKTFEEQKLWDFAFCRRHCSMEFLLIPQRKSQNLSLSLTTNHPFAQTDAIHLAERELFWRQWCSLPLNRSFRWNMFYMLHFCFCLISRSQLEFSDYCEVFSGEDGRGWWDAQKTTWLRIEDRSLAGNATSQWLSLLNPPLARIKNPEAGFLICSLGGFSGARSDARGTRQGQCCRRRLREGGVPVSCAIACKINPDLDDRLFREKNNLDLGLGNVGKRKCRLLLWSVRPPWKGPAGTWINVKIFIGNSFDEYHVCGWPVKYFF